MNAVYSTFQANKVKRLVYSKGTMYKVTRNPMTEYGEPDEDATEDVKENHIHALLHNEKPSKDRTDDGVVTKFSQSEMLLCCYSDAHSIRVGDRVQDILSGTEYEVENVNNVQEGNFAIDLSLRRVIHGIDV
nr:MAG TPA: hypothetical protein [Bacteriophage sp.]